MEQDNYIFFICYPGGDKSKLTVAYESWATEYEISDYALASRERFYEPKEAIEYCKKLAINNNLQFIPSLSSFGVDTNDYLD